MTGFNPNTTDPCKVSRGAEPCQSSTSIRAGGQGRKMGIVPLLDGHRGEIIGFKLMPSRKPLALGFLMWHLPLFENAPASSRTLQPLPLTERAWINLTTSVGVSGCVGRGADALAPFVLMRPSECFPGRHLQLPPVVTCKQQQQLQSPWTPRVSRTCRGRQWSRSREPRTRVARRGCDNTRNCPALSASSSGARETAVEGIRPGADARRESPCQRSLGWWRGFGSCT